ncbi:MAG: DUF4249 domain-containing protein [Bacteroidota bacterium]
MKEFYQTAKVISALLILAASCITPVEPEFKFRDNIIFIDGYALTEEGKSSISIQRSVLLNERFYTEAVDGAKVLLINTMTSEEITCSISSDGLYLPPNDFKVEPEESWKLYIELADGRRFESTPEVVSEGVTIDNIEATYSDEITFLEEENKFVPGHSVSIDWTDPVKEENFYLWKYKTYEPLIVCKTCERGRFRNGECIQESNFRFRNFDYLCGVPCWLIRYNESFQIFDDELVDGESISRPVAIVPFYRNQDILIEIQQLSLNKESYQYFDIINDILVENSGLNAPPPAALAGNIVNADDPSEVVLGQFTATTSSTLTLYIDRSEITVPAINPETLPALEDTTNPDHIIIAPCEEGRERTSVKPAGWK